MQDEVRNAKVRSIAGGQSPEQCVTHERLVVNGKDAFCLQKGDHMNYVIAINREYGSGGKTIGEMLAKDLGIEYYEKDLEVLAAEDSGINEALFVDAHDKTKSVRSFLNNGPTIYHPGDLIGPESPDFTSPKNLFNYQAKVIRNLAEKESCVIIGHCGGYILEDMENVVRVFVHAPMDFLLEQAAQKKSLPPAELEKYVNMINRNRADFFEKYTGRQWNDARNYDLCLNSGKLGFEKCMDIIKGYISVRFR